MKFSVLLSVYRKEQPPFLQQSLESIFTQTLLPDEVVLVKDGPLTVELDQVIESYVLKYPVLKVIPLPLNQGLGKALNEGLKHCSFDLVARMDTDDIAYPTRFEKQIEVFRKLVDIDVVGTWINEFIGNKDNIISMRSLPQYHTAIKQYAKSRCPLNHVTVMFNKQAVKQVGGYQSLLLYEDYFLWVRMLLNGSVFYNIPEPLVWVRNSDDMYRRRGGWRYTLTEIKFFSYLYQIHFISKWECLKDISIRVCVRLLPNYVRKFIYIHLLR